MSAAVVRVCVCVCEGGQRRRVGVVSPQISRDCNPALEKEDVEVICKAWLILNLGENRTLTVIFPRCMKGVVLQMTWIPG